MAYSLVGIIAIIIHFIVNLDIFVRFRDKKPFPGQKFYLFFLLNVIAYHITDAFWGFFYDAKLVVPLFADTTIYFITMASSILFWGYFIFEYLGAKKKTIIYASLVVFSMQIVVIALNFAFPILFTVSDECEYKAQIGRYVMLSVQILMFLILSISTFIESIKKQGSMKRHYLMVGVFSLFMMVAIILQVIFPLLPMYSYGYLFGITILHTLVVEDEKANQRLELAEARYQVSFDALTGAMSKHAYVDAEAEIDDAINKGEMEDFAMVVFDLNNLKDVNDRFGHEAGDKYIVDSVRLIEDCFKEVPIYRVGGDEFTIILKGQEFKDRNKLLDNFNKMIDENVKNHSVVVVAAGISDFDHEKDTTIIQIFTRADREMYARKHYLKEKTA